MNPTLRPPVDLSELLVHREWMQSLARSLAQDETAAEDAVQQTWLAALEHPPRHRGNLRAWLACTLRNFALRERRGQTRRERREQASRPAPPHPDARESAEAAEMQRRVLGLVLDLPEPYRSTVLLRFFDGLKAREIAERSGVATGTVESRLHRAMTRIRAQLDLDYEERGAWIAGLGSAGLLCPPAKSAILSGWGVAAALTLSATVVTVLVTRDPAKARDETPTAHEVAMASGQPGELGEGLGSPRPPAIDSGGPGPGTSSAPAPSTADSSTSPGTSSSRPSVRPGPQASTPPASLRPEDAKRLESLLIKRVRKIWEVQDDGQDGRADTERQSLREFLRAQELRLQHPDLLAEVALWQRVFDAARASTLRWKEVGQFAPGWPSDDPGLQRCGPVLSAPHPDARHRSAVLIALAPPQPQLSPQPGRKRVRKADHNQGLDALCRWASQRYDAAFRRDHIVLVVARDPSWESWTSDAAQRALFSLAGDAVYHGLLHDSSRVFLDTTAAEDPDAWRLAERFPSLLAGMLVTDRASLGETSEALQGNLQHQAILRASGVPGADGSALLHALRPRHPPPQQTSSLGAFLAAHPRPFEPHPIQMRARNLAEASGYWLRVLDVDPMLLQPAEALSLLADYDPESQSIVLRLHPAIRSVQLFLNDNMLDLDREVRLELTRLESQDPSADPPPPPRHLLRKLRRDLDTTLGLAYWLPHGNPGAVFTADWTIHLE